MWSSEDQKQVTLRPVAGELCYRAVRALKVLVEARQTFPRDLTDEVQMLQEALLSTPFGQSYAPQLLAKLLCHAEYVSTLPDTILSLTGVNDGIYVLLTGSAEIARAAVSTSRNLIITVEAAFDLHGDRETDTLDPYVVMQCGAQEHRSPVLDDAGANPVFNWSARVTWDGESGILFNVWEYDQYSRDDHLGVVFVEPAYFRNSDYEAMLALDSKRAEDRSGSKDASRNLGGMKRHEQPAGFLKVHLRWEKLGVARFDAPHKDSVPDFPDPPRDLLRDSSTGSSSPSRRDRKSVV